MLNNNNRKDITTINGGKAKVGGTYSRTTLRHINEFLQQHGFKGGSAKEIMAMYGNAEIQ